MNLENWISIFAYGLLLAPFLSALLTLLLYKVMGIYVYRISLGFSLLGVLLASTMLIIFYANSLEELKIFQETLVAINITPLSLIMGTFVSFVSLVIHRYSVNYMYDEEGYVRFFILLDTMVAFILILLFCSNLIALFLFWHLIGVNLYFLLVHNFTRENAYRYAFYTLFTHLLADIPLFIAIYLIERYYGTVDLNMFLSQVSAGVLHVTHVFSIEVSVLQLIGFFIMLSALIKSAQFPFHIWLAYTLEGPNPVSALMHAGIVNAGAILVNRFAPVFVHANISLHVAFFIGLITAILGSTLMLVQNDVKKTLAYSTMGQMGYMMLEIGVGAFSLAVYHLIVHGVFKATLFLSSGNVIAEARKAPNISGKTYFNFFFSEEHETGNTPWFVHAMLTTVVPMAAVVGIYYWLSGGLVHFQGEVVLLFFAWLTGAQTIFTVYRTVMRKMWTMLLLSTLLFAAAIVTYLSAAHWFDGLIFITAHLSDAIFETAAIPELLFYTIISIALFSVVIGWIVAYYGEENSQIHIKEFKSLYRFVYKTLSRELYILDITSRVSRKLIKFSAKMNTKLRF